MLVEVERANITSRLRPVQSSITSGNQHLEDILIEDSMHIAHEIANVANFISIWNLGISWRKKVGTKSEYIDR